MRQSAEYDKCHQDVIYGSKFVLLILDEFQPKICRFNMFVTNSGKFREKCRPISSDLFQNYFIGKEIHYKPFLSEIGLRFVGDIFGSSIRRRRFLF